MFDSNQLRSIEGSISQEITAVKKQASAIWLDIDAIKFVRQQPNGYVYNLLLSKPANFSPEQPISFHLKGGATIEATVLSSSDEGLLVLCSKPLHENAVVLNISFDPSFILFRLRQFIEEIASKRLPLVQKILQKSLDPPNRRHALADPKDLNEDQRTAIAQMSADQIHLLWGPPGTGKTTTLGAAISGWVREGKTVLVVSTSNAAVDEVIKGVGKRLGQDPAASRRLFRLGKSENTEAIQICKGDLATAAVVGSTLAKMVMDKNLQLRTFDIVVVDESSMVSLIYAVAAASFAKSQIVYAGDFMQLPPICQGKAGSGDQWFGQNLYDWLEITFETGPDLLPITLLRTQYRMTEKIGGLVGHLCYRNQLIHGRKVKGSPVEFIDVPKQWQESFYSVAESSYYHPFSIPIIHSLVDALATGDAKEFLLLTPFRPQQSLLGALAFDLKDKHDGHRFASSTIHRSQGGERRVVILDLTTHNSTDLVHFFRDRHSERLLNVGMSRARDHLVIIGNQQMIWGLAEKNPFWRRLLDKWDDISVCQAEEILDEPVSFDELKQLLTASKLKGMPSICCTGSIDVPISSWIGLLSQVESPRKLLVSSSKQTATANIIFRQRSDCPPLFVGQGFVAMPVDDKWAVTKSANAARVIWRVGFSHLADEEVQPSVADKVFQCPKCEPGKLVLRVMAGEQRLGCNNDRFRCFYHRPLSFQDATMKIRLSGFRCPKGHPMTARQGGRGIFMGCENHPDCDAEPVPLKLIEGM